MKIKPEHYEFIKSACAKVSRESISAHRCVLLKDIRVKDVEKRLRWDVLYATNLSSWLCDNVYPYADDSHVDTAVRKIFTELKITD